MANKEKKGFFKEFKVFISRGNVLDMAVGIIVGGAFTAIITAIVSGILTPLLQAIGVGESGFGVLQVVLNQAAVTAKNAEPIILDFGIVISAIITFLLTAFILFLIVWTINRVRDRADAIKAKRVAKAEAAKAEEAPAEEAAPEEPAPAPQPTVEELLAQIRDLLAAQSGSVPPSQDDKKD